MRRLRQLALLFALSLGLAQEVVDRMVAVVNKQVILESELDQARRVELLVDGKPLPSEPPEPQEIRALLDRLIDRALLEQQIASPGNPEILDPKPEELAERIKQIRGRIPGAATEDGWEAVLKAYGLELRDLEKHLITEFRVLHFIDLRFRGLVRVDRAAIDTYYLETFLPELTRQGSSVPPLAEVSSKIERILIEQQMDEMLNEWLQTLRTQSHIEKLEPFGAIGVLSGGRS
jgi:hypothetical protein